MKIKFFVLCCLSVALLSLAFSAPVSGAVRRWNPGGGFRLPSWDSGTLHHPCLIAAPWGVEAYTFSDPNHHTID